MHILVFYTPFCPNDTIYITLCNSLMIFCFLDLLENWSFLHLMPFMEATK